MTPEEIAARNADPNYIGATNFSNLQKQYTPYQLEQSTVRKGADIYWNPNVKIGDIPSAAPLTPPPTTAPLPSSATATTTPTMTAPPSTGAADYLARNNAATAYLSGAQKSIDDLNANREALLTKQKEAQQTEVNGLQEKLKAYLGFDKRQDALKENRDLFQVENQIRDLGTVRQKIADAQAALSQGLIYEEGRPTRMGLMVGRSAQLQKQGLAQIQSLQSTAEIIKGNIDLASAYADDSIAALTQDTQDQKDALGTLMTMANSKLITLSADEKDVISERMKTLNDEATRIKESKDAIFELATSYPQSFMKGNVTFLDTREEALRKMGPHLAESERLDLAQKQAALDATGRSNRGGGSGGSGGTSVFDAFDPSDQDLIAAAFAQGIKLDQLIIDLGGPSKLNAKQLNQLQDFWSTHGKPSTPVAAGMLEDAGINVAEHPELIGADTETVKRFLQQQKTDKTVEDAKKGVWWNPFTWGAK